VNEVARPTTKVWIYELVVFNQTSGLLVSVVRYLLWVGLLLQFPFTDMAIASTNDEHRDAGDTPSAIPPNDLPSSKATDVELVVAKDAEHLQCSRMNGVEWKGPLTIEQYLKREKHLMAQNLTKGGNEAGWVLTCSSLPTDSQGNRPILASCETIPSQAFVARNGKLDPALIQGVGSVFTRPEHRGKSYASRMLTDLGQKLETFQHPDRTRSPFSILFSDIGQNFYSRLGWHAFPSTHIQLVPIDTNSYHTISAGLPTTRDLVTEDLKTLDAVATVQEELIRRSKAQPETNFVALAPDFDHFEWHHAREEFICKALNRPSPQIKGAIHEPTGISVVWNRTFAGDKKEWTLHILHTSIPSSAKDSSESISAIAALFVRAQHEAFKSDMAAGVEIWDPSEEVLRAANLLRKEGDKIEVIERDQDHVCSLRWSGPDGKVEWLYKEKYTWC
jgi:hypothetical protein